MYHLHSKRRSETYMPLRYMTFVTCSPAEELEFVFTEDSQEATDTITLKNTLPYNIAYKVGVSVEIYHLWLFVEFG